MAQTDGEPELKLSAILWMTWMILSQVVTSNCCMNAKNLSAKFALSMKQQYLENLLIKLNYNDISRKQREIS